MPSEIVGTSTEAVLAPALLDAVDDVTRLAGWPTLIDGDGSPCRPEAFGEHEYRVAFVEGVNRLAKYLARDVEVQVNAEVASLRGPTSEEHDWELVLTSGDRIAARHVVLTIPAPAAAELVRRSERVPADVARLLPLIDLVRMLPCLTVMARYDEQAPRPAWEISLPRA